MSKFFKKLKSPIIGVLCFVLGLCCNRFDQYINKSVEPVESSVSVEPHGMGGIPDWLLELQDVYDDKEFLGSELRLVELDNKVTSGFFALVIENKGGKVYNYGLVVDIDKKVRNRFILASPRLLEVDGGFCFSKNSIDYMSTRINKKSKYRSVLLRDDAGSILGVKFTEE